MGTNVGQTRADDKLLNRVFGELLRELRTSKGLSQERLADLADVHRNHISYMERGVWGASLFTLLKLANGLQIPPGEFVAQVVARMQASEQDPEPSA